MSQLALPLAWPPDPGDEAFLVSPSNAQAVQQLGNPASWPVHTAVLTGPRKSGRTLLARIVAAGSGARVIDNAELQPETELFHAWNRAQEERRPLILVADAAPPAWAVRLPDLRSRLLASPVAVIGPPDDELMPLLLNREFARRGLDARPELVTWLTTRLERSHLAALRAVDVLDQASFESRKRLSISLARNVLAAASLIEASALESL